jgi:hypothetical protein
MAPKSFNPDYKIPEMVSMLSTLGNIVTGFAAAQGIAFGYVTLQTVWAQKVGVPNVLWIVTVLILIGITLESFVVWWCDSTSVQFLVESPPEVRTVFEKVAYVRITCVLLFGLACLCAAWGPLVDEHFKQKQGSHPRNASDTHQVHY